MGGICLLKTPWLIGSVVVGGLLVLTGCGSTSSVAKSTNLNHIVAPSRPIGASEHWKKMPNMFIQPNRQYSALVKTNYGNFTIQLFAKKSPETVNSFVFLVNHKFYNGDRFFRIIQNFMIQTGDPNNNGTGGPGYTIPDELPPSVPYTAGVVAMANTGQPHSGGSQFFICTVNDSQQLNPSYTELGKVVSGMNVIKKIAAIPVVANPNMGGEMSKPTKTAFIESITITKH